jgi:hypothetical protein
MPNALARLRNNLQKKGIDPSLLAGGQGIPVHNGLGM